jgi:glucose/arabinose dehydrogenase
MVLPGHSAPLDILFYGGGSFPDAYDGDALVTLHGSWNAEPPVGYKVVRIPFDDDGMPLGTWEPLYEYRGAGDTAADWGERPVDMAVLPVGTLLVTSDDDSDRVIAIDYRP